MPDPYHLNALRKAADRKRRAEDDYRAALVRAREAGATLPAMASAAGVTKPTIWRNLERARERKP